MHSLSMYCTFLSIVRKSTETGPRKRGGWVSGEQVRGGGLGRALICTNKLLWICSFYCTHITLKSMPQIDNQCTRSTIIFTSITSPDISRLPYCNPVLCGFQSILVHVCLSLMYVYFDLFTAYRLGISLCFDSVVW